MGQSKGKYVFLDAEAEEEDVPKAVESQKIHWRLSEYISGLPCATKLKSFHEQIVKFNEKINLVSRKSIYNSDLLNFYDSIVSSQAILKDVNSDEIHDIGSGNGFPGMVMAMLDPSKNFVLVDRERKKIEFLKYIASSLQLKNVRTICSEFSDIEQGSMSCAVTRGFASISKALLLCRRNLQTGGHFYHLKGPLWSNEVGEMPPQLISHWETSLFHEYDLPENLGTRFVVKTKYR